MSGWWPWARSGQAVPAPASAVTATDAGWRRLAPIQRATAPMSPIASPREFVESLTVTHDPGLVSPPPPLATEHADRLSVLPVAGESAPEPASNGPPPADPEHSRRTWTPRLPIQRATLGAGSLVQEPEAVPAPADASESPLEAEELPVGVQELSGSLVEAPDPGERRSVQVVSELPTYLPATGPGTDAEIAYPATASESGKDSSNSTLPTPPMAVASSERQLPIQRASDSTAEPRATTVTASTPTSAAVPSAPAEPRLPVQRAADTEDSQGGADTGSTPMSVAAVFEPDKHEPEEIPAMPVVPAMNVTPLTPIAETAAPVVAAPGPDVAPPANPAVPAQHPQAANPVGPADVGQVQRTVGPLPPVQRWPEPDKPASESAHTTAPGPSAAALPGAVEADAADMGERPSIVVAQPMPAATESVTTRSVPQLPLQPEHVVAQRLSGPPDPAAPELTVSPLRVVERDAAPTPPAPGGLSAPRPSVPLPVVQRSPAADGARAWVSGPPTPSATSTVAAAFPPAVQRFPMPVVAPTAPNTQPERRDPTEPAQPSLSLEAASAPTGARVVVLPPVRSSTASDSSAAATALSVIADSPRPVSLQRMFENTARTAAAPVSSTTDASTTAHADPEMCTVTFDSPVVQRETDGGAPSAAAPATQEPSTGGTAAPTTTATAQAGGGVPATTNIQELVNQIYDPLAARLRAELWLDRERAGVLMDLRR
jgi:hypothetical protein